jgi:CubicO group peptidase (beta-lactamase class C family)
VFAYNQPCTYTLAAIVQRGSGQSLVDYLRPRLFDPLGIGDVAWIEHPAGQNIGFSGLHATTDAIARLGQLYLQRGRWADRQLLDPAWVDEATRSQVENPLEPNPDWRQGYGFQFWMARHGYRGDGAFGQFCIVLPEADLVIVTTAQTLDMQGILDAVWAHILPAIDRVGADPGADGRLAERLANGALPVAPAKADPDDRGAWDGASFVAGRRSETEAAELGELGIALTGVGMRAGAAGWLITLADAGGRLEAPVGTGEWAVSELSGVPVAIAGGWSDPDTFVADVIFLDTPHSVRLLCSGPDRTFAAHWRSTPLHPHSVLELRRP